MAISSPHEFNPARVWGKSSFGPEDDLAHRRALKLADKILSHSQSDAGGLPEATPDLNRAVAVEWQEMGRSRDPKRNQGVHIGAAVLGPSIEVASTLQ
jgi:hypothetical protein